MNLCLSLQEPVPYHEVIQAIVDQHGAFIDGDLALNATQGRQTVEAEDERVRVETQHAVLGDEGALLAEMVQEEEQEKEDQELDDPNVEVETRRKKGPAGTVRVKCGGIRLRRVVQAEGGRVQSAHWRPLRS